VSRVPPLVWFALAYGLLLEALLAPAILFWPEFSANLEALSSMAKAVPMVGEMLRSVEEQGLPAYVLGQHFFKGCNALGTAAAVLFAAPAIAGEAHRGTLEMLLARPFSRRRLLLERYAAGAAAVVVPVFLTSLTIPYLCERVDEYVSYGPYLACAAHQSLFLLAIYGVTFLGSCLASNPTRVALVVLFLAVSQFALYMVKTVTHSSVFRLCDMEVLLDVADGEWNGPIVLGLALACVLALGAALFAFERRTP